MMPDLTHADKIPETLGRETGVEMFVDRAQQMLATQADAATFDPTMSPARGDHDLNAGTDPLTLTVKPRAAAVLVPVVPRQGGLRVLLTLRSAHLPTHAGQISFPGGKMEPQDDGPLDTALREADEEVGLDPGLVQPLGYLDTYQTSTGFRIVPVVGLVQAEHRLTLDPSEVDEAFEVPLAFLMNPSNHQRHTREWRGRPRQYYAMPWHDRYIWGATAGIIRNLQETVFPQ